MGFKNTLKSFLARVKHRQYPNDVRIDYSAQIANTSFEGCNSVGLKSVVVNSKIGFGTYIAANSVVTGTKIGKYCSIGPDLKMPTGLHPTHTFVSTSPCFFSLAAQNGITYVSEQKFCEYKEAEDGYGRVIGNDVWIGGNVTLLEGITIGDGCIIGAGAVVTKSTPPYSICVGVPARVIKWRFNEEQIKKLLQVRWWDCDREWIRDNAEHFLNIENFLSIVLEKHDYLEGEQVFEKER